MKIMFDVDGVLADFYTAFHRLGIQMGVYDKIPPEPPHLWDWDKTAAASKVWDEINKSTTFWAEEVEPFNELYTLDGDSQLQNINDMCYNNDVYFVTARRSPNAKQQTELWLWNHGIDTPTVVLTKLKGEFASAANIDFSIEDKVENAWCVAWLSNAKSFLLDKPYNQVPKGLGSSKIIRVNSVKEYLDIIEEEESDARL